MDTWVDAVPLVGEPSVARRFARLVTEPDFGDLPSQAVEYAKMLVASTVASAAMGTQVRTAQIVREIVGERAGVAQATLWFERTAASLPDAVRVNAVRSSAAASDDSDLRNLVHAGTAVTTAALAAGEYACRDGTEIVAAIVLGYEAAARMGAAITPGFRRAGFHGCVAAVFGAAVASGRLLGLGTDQMTHAIALAATSMAGLLRSAEVSNAREHFDSMAATSGVEVALAAGHGFTGDEWVFEGERGFFEVFGGTTPEVGTHALCSEFGDTWELATSLAFKLVPGGHPFHAAAEASAKAVRDLAVDPDQISSLQIAAPGLQRLRGPLHPTDLLEMAHSQAYFVAAAANDGTFSWVHARLDKINDPDIHRLIDLVSVDTTPCATPERFRMGATVTAHTFDGRHASVTVLEPSGSTARGVAWAEMAEKFRALVPCSSLTPDQVESCLVLIRRLDKLEDLTTLLAALNGGEH